MTKGKKLVFWVLGILCLLLILYTSLNSLVNSKVKRQLTEELNLQYNQVHTSLWNKSITIDSLFLQSKKGKIQALTISNISWLDLAKSKKLDLNTTSFVLKKLYYPVNELQYLSIDSLSKEGSNINIFEMVFSSPYSTAEYMNALVTRKPYIALNFPKIELYEVDLNQRIVQSIKSNEFSCQVSEDLNIQLNQKKKKLLAQLIREIEQEFKIYKIDLKNGTIEYALKDKGSEEWGNMKFNDVHIIGEGIRNDSTAIAENQSMVLELKGKVENRAPIIVVTKHFLGEQNYHFDLYASLSDLDLDHGNDILRSSKGVIIKAGKINRLEMEGRFNDHLSEGVVKIDYENLKIDLNRKYDGVLNLLGNAAINDDKKASETFELNRNQEKSFMIHIWQSLITALRKLILVV